MRATSGSTRCAAAPTSSAPTCTSSAARGAARSCGSSCRLRTAPMAAETDEKIRVLVVDDHAVVRRGLFAFLEGERDIEVVGGAEGGEEALRLLERLETEGRRPHVVLMDLQMEPLDGIESTRRVRARYDDVDVVALTSFDDVQRVRAALEAGASGYLLKDADVGEIAVAVRAAHRGELRLDSAVAQQLAESLRAPRDPELTSR